MTLREYIGAGLMLCGALVFCISMLGVYRFDYVLSRMHAAAITDTLGSLLVLGGLGLLRGASLASAKLALVLVVLWITGPVGTNSLASAELRLGDEYKKHCQM